MQLPKQQLFTIMAMEVDLFVIQTIIVMIIATMIAIATAITNAILIEVVVVDHGLMDGDHLIMVDMAAVIKAIPMAMEVVMEATVATEATDATVAMVAIVAAVAMVAAGDYYLFLKTIILN